MEPLFTSDIHAFLEHTKIPLAVYYVEDGRFRTYLVSEGSCDMYEFSREEMMERLNGDDPFVNIVEKDEMYAAVREFSEENVPYNVIFHEYIGKDRKLKTIHGIGGHEYTKDGRRYSIIRYDEISDSSRRALFHEEEEKIAEQRRIFNEIDDAIARSFTSVFYVDTKDQSVTAVRLNKIGRTVREGLGETADLKEVMEHYVNTLVFKDDIESVRRFGDFNYVMERLKETNPAFHTYRTIREGLIVNYRLKIVPFDNGSKIVFGFEDYDDQIREEVAKRTEREMQMTLLAGLSCEYESIWLVDASLHHGRLIRSNIKNVDRSRTMNAISSGNYETIIGTYIDRYVVAEDRKRVYDLSSIDNLMRNTKEDEIYHINYNRTAPEGDKNYIQLSIARVTDNKGVVRFVCGFRNIDLMMEEEKHKTMLYSMAYIDNMTRVNNRRTFDEFMDSAEATEIKNDSMIFSFDLNDLKTANDSRGHEAGDELIIGAAQCMKRVLGPYGTIYRTGGDEFVAFCNIPDDVRRDVINQLVESFDNWHGNLYPKLSVSMGYVCASEDPTMQIKDMMREADKRMYARKSEYYMKEGNDRRRK